METNARIPKTILNRIDELNALVERYPYNIPVTVIAKYLHMDIDRFRFAALHGGVPFSIQWEDASREVKVNTLAFYNWMMGGGRLLSLYEGIAAVGHR